jgi:hypothetical protein
VGPRSASLLSWASEGRFASSASMRRNIS